MLASVRDDPAQAIEAILDEGRKTRKPLPRGLWVVSIAIALVCVVALAIGLVQSWNVKPLPRPHAGSAAGR